MLGGNEKGEIHTLPGIEEDVNKSSESLTTLDSETLTLESLEADLFEDIRASIHKSNKVSDTANSSGKKELKTMDSRTVSCKYSLFLFVSVLIYAGAPTGFALIPQLPLQRIPFEGNVIIRST